MSGLIRETRYDLAMLETAYVAWAPDIYRAARAITGDQRAAEDVMHETFVKAQQSFATYDPDRPIRPWLTSIAVHLAINHGRRERLRRLVERGLLVATARQSDADIVDLRIDLDAALRTLSPRERGVVVARHYAGMSYQEIAAALRITPDNAGVILHRAHKRLRAALALPGNAMADVSLVPDRHERIR